MNLDHKTSYIKELLGIQKSRLNTIDSILEGSEFIINPVNLSDDELKERRVIAVERIELLENVLKQIENNSL